MPYPSEISQLMHWRRIHVSLKWHKQAHVWITEYRDGTAFLSHAKCSISIYYLSRGESNSKSNFYMWWDINGICESSNGNRCWGKGHNWLLLYQISIHTMAYATWKNLTILSLFWSILHWDLAYSRLPNSRGHPCVSIGNFSKCMGQLAWIVNLDDTKDYTAQD